MTKKYWWKKYLINSVKYGKYIFEEESVKKNFHIYYGTVPVLVPEMVNEPSTFIVAQDHPGPN